MEDEGKIVESLDNLPPTLASSAGNGDVRGLGHACVPTIEDLSGTAERKL